VTTQDLIIACEQAGIVLMPADEVLEVDAPAGALTPRLWDELKSRKGDLLPVLVRLHAMRRHGVDLTGKGTRPAVPVAQIGSCGGPGRCFSCDDALPREDAYGRCAACDVACDLFYRSAHSKELADL